jgi:hypothetical protein
MDREVIACSAPYFLKYEKGQRLYGVDLLTVDLETGMQNIETDLVMYDDLPDLEKDWSYLDDDESEYWEGVYSDTMYDELNFDEDC